jgi:Protein of unknown function (DUF3606)
MEPVGHLQPEKMERRFARTPEVTLAALPTKPLAHRSMIAMDHEDEVKYWTITKEALQETVDKVGNSAAAVRKELKARRAAS